jgi:hypothetical protein
MPKYEVSAEIVLRTYITPHGYFVLDSDVEDFEDESSWGEETIVQDGGSISFVFETDAEDVGDAAAMLLQDNLMFQGDDFEWEFESITITDVEEVEVPMTRGRAVEILRAYLVRPSEANAEDLRKAIEFLLAFMAARPHLTTPPVNQEVA